MKGRALVIQSQSVTRALDFFIEDAVWQFQRAACHLVHRQAVGRYRVPQSEKADFRDRPLVRNVVHVNE